MDAREAKRQGFVVAAAGMCFVTVAVVLFGLTTAEGGVDVVSVITAVAGFGMVLAGLFRTFHHSPRPSV